MSLPEKTQAEHDAILKAIEGYSGLPREAADEALGRAIEVHLLGTLNRWGGLAWAEAMAAATGWVLPHGLRDGVRNRVQNAKPEGAARRSSRRAK